MAKKVTQISVLISCPSDVDPERKIVRDVCDSLTKVLNKTMNIVIKPIDWEKDVVPLISGQGPQEVIDAQTKDYDIYIGIMWRRFGDKQPNGLTPTEWEFQKALQRMRRLGDLSLHFISSWTSPLRLVRMKKSNTVKFRNSGKE